MSNICNYLPNPSRVWSRTQNQCTYTNVAVSLSSYKENVLQHKGNSSRLTKSQKYAQIAKGLGLSRTKTFATQSQTYTNPNTTGLQRINYSTIPFPNTAVGEPNNISGPFQCNVPNPNGCSGTSLQDGGTLKCGYYAKPCTGEIIHPVTVNTQQIVNNSTNDCCSYYNKLMLFDPIIKVKSYLQQFIYNMTSPTNIMNIGLDTYNSINLDLYNITKNMVPSDCFKDVINTYSSIIKTIKYSDDLKQSVIGSNDQITTWKEDSEILHDQDKLTQFLQEQAEIQNNTFGKINVKSAKATLKPQYCIYHELYGIPDNFEYDPVLLSQITA